MPRSKDLPDFTRPPLVEVALFTQYERPAGYHEIFAYEVWQLFRGEFPLVEEKPPADPVFEVFGGPTRAPNMELKLFHGPMRTRYWFLTPDNKELIQFQSDRFVHNWRKLTDDAVYPRYDVIVEKYRKELVGLNALFISKNWGRLVTNQAELTYVNRIPLLDASGAMHSPSFFFKRVDPLLGGISELTLSARRVMAIDGKPVARLFLDSSMAQGPNGDPVLNLNLTVRGAPVHDTYQSALDFLDEAHLLIVSTFVDITSDAAHKMWGRIQ